jgi:hypothetical protein
VPVRPYDPINKPASSEDSGSPREDPGSPRAGILPLGTPSQSLEDIWSRTREDLQTGLPLYQHSTLSDREGMHDDGVSTDWEEAVSMDRFLRAFASHAMLHVEGASTGIIHCAWPKATHEARWAFREISSRDNAISSLKLTSRQHAR